MLRELDRGIGLIDAMASCIRDSRDPAKITDDLRTVTAQRILAVAMGYDAGNDHHDLGNDSLLQLVTERGIDPLQPPASRAARWGKGVFLR